MLLAIYNCPSNQTGENRKVLGYMINLFIWLIWLQGIIYYVYMAARKKEKGKSHVLVEIVQNYGVELGLKLFHELVLNMAYTPFSYH